MMWPIDGFHFSARQFSDSICSFGKFQICSQFQGARFNQSEPSARRCFGWPRLLLFSCLQLFGIKISRHMILILSKMFQWTTGWSVDQLVKFMWTEQNTFSMTSFESRFWNIWRQETFHNFDQHSFVMKVFRHETQLILDIQLY